MFLDACLSKATTVSPSKPLGLLHSAPANIRHTPHSVSPNRLRLVAEPYHNPKPGKSPGRGGYENAPEERTNILSMLIAFGMTLLGAIASYSFKVLNGEAFSWRTPFLQLFVSIFAGLTMVMIALHYD